MACCTQQIITHLLAAPAPGEVIRQASRGFAWVKLPAGTYKLPDNGLPLFAQAQGNVTLTTAGGSPVATPSNGQIALCLPLTSTTWAATILATGGTPMSAGDVEFANGSTDASNVEDAIAAMLGVLTPQIIQVPLTSLREVSTMAVGNAAANGGLLASDTTPSFGPINGATAGCQRVQWASSNNDAVIFQVSLPPNFDESQDLVLNARIASGGTSNAVGFTVTSYFGEAGAAVSDTTGTNQTTAYQTVTATIAAADVTASSVLTVSLTPVAHTTDALNLTGLWLSVPVLIASP